MLIFRFVEISGGSALCIFDRLEFHQGTALGQVHVHFLDVTVLLKVLMQGPNVIMLLGKVQHNNAVALDLFSCQLGRQQLLRLILSLTANIALMVSAMLLLLMPRLTLPTLSLKVLMASLEVLIPSLVSIVLVMSLHIHLLMLLLLRVNLNLHWDGGDLLQEI